MDNLKYKAIIKMDLTIRDNYHDKLIKNKPKEPLGDAVTIEGTLEEIQDRICFMIQKSADVLEDWYNAE